LSPEPRKPASPEPRKPSSSPSARSPLPRGSDSNRANDVGRVPAARAFEPIPSYESRAYGPDSFAGSMSAAQAETVRRLPKSGIRDRPRGLPVNEAAAQRTRPRRILGIMIILLLIGVGVAVGVAFSGPELEVIDPQALPSGGTANPGGPAHQQVAPSSAVTPPKPTELPGPPAATPATP
jgi:hypothetical protein